MVVTRPHTRSASPIAVGQAPNRRPAVVAFGHAVVDVLSQCHDDLVRTHGLAKNMTTVVSPERAMAIYSSMTAIVTSPGGSAANTAAGLASFGLTVAFVGKVGQDRLGSVFADGMRAAGVQYETSPASTEGAGTARVMILVTSDGERTMSACLGVAGDITAQDVDETLLSSAEIVYLEGYLVGLDPAKLGLQKAVAIARASGRRIALTLSDPKWVADHRLAFTTLLPKIDVLFANEAEATALVGASDIADALKILSGKCPIVAVTRGQDGAVVLYEGKSPTVPAYGTARVIDTTGAGDLFAAGFLAGLLRNKPIESCARLGTFAAAKIISQLGGRPKTSLAAEASLLGLL